MKVAIVTNRPAHYRLPIFKLLAERWDTKFFFTATSTGRWWTSSHNESAAGLEATVGVPAVRLYRALRKDGYDCVVGSLTGRSHLAATGAAVDVGRKPFVLWAELWQYPRSTLHALGRPLVDHLLRRADAIVAGGTHTSRWIEDEVGRTHDVHLLLNPVDTRFFSQELAAQEVAAVRTSFGLSARAIGCFVGRLEPEKGLPILLQAVSETQSEFALVVVGTGSRAEEINELAARLEILDRVRCVGWVTQQELPLYYRASDFLIIPSVSTRLFREPWGLVVNEAMAGGLPVIASDAVGAAASGLVEHGETGLVVPEGNPTALAAAIDKLSKDSQLRNRLGATAKARATTYTFDKAAAVFTAAVEQAVESR